LLSLLFLLLPGTTAAKPPLREILAHTPLTKAQIDQVLEGKLITSDVVEVSDRELGGAVACLLPAGQRGSLAFAQHDRVIMPDDYKDTSGPIDPNDIERSLAALNLGGNEKEARRYLDLEPGFDMNLSAEEIATFRALEPPTGGEIAAVEAKLREIYARRIRAYREHGLDGIAPFARGDEDAEGGSPARDLRQATEASVGFRDLMPEYYSALLTYPDNQPPGAREFLLWSRIQVLGRPVFLLHQRLAAASEDSEVVVERQIYASHFLNVSQTVIGLVPVSEGTLAVYANRTWVDKWHGWGTSAKRKVGKKLLKGILTTMAEQFRLCEGIPHSGP
jgi:hypothetical protein